MLVGGCRVPFEARSMAELRTKVMAGRFKPISPGKYSADLINLMGQLLQVNPQRRPEVSKILASSVVQKHAAGGSHKAAPPEPSSKGNVLQTIKVPPEGTYLLLYTAESAAVSGTVRMRERKKWEREQLRLQCFVLLSLQCITCLHHVL